MLNLRDENYRISFSHNQFEAAIVTHGDEKEDVTYSGAFATRVKGVRKDLVRYVLVPDSTEVDRDEYFVEPNPHFTCKLQNLFRKEGANTVVNLHWHKFTESGKQPNFFSEDDRCAFALFENISQFNPSIRVVQIVFGASINYFKARYMDKDKKFVYFDSIEIVGPQGIKILNSGKEFDVQISINDFKEIFRKNILAFGNENTSKISKIKVAVVGVGGLGSGIVYQMARIGFEDVILMDFDRISEDNCNRFYGTDLPQKARGKLKAEFVMKKYQCFNPNATVQCYYGSVLDEKAEEILKEVDLIIMTVDNDGTRVSLNSFCARYGKPLVNVSTGISMDKDGSLIKSAGTQIQWFIPRESEYPCLRCHGSMDEEEIQMGLMSEELRESRKTAGYIEGTDQNPAPQIMPLNGIGIGIAMWEICCWICGIKKPIPWLYYDAMENKLMNIKVSQKSDCTCCRLNEESILATGDYKPNLKIKILNR
ncbi:hypothetical protein AUJ66_08715 [Candidatus Desantisbacteria bacterium CG1_02_38_46]|uniref:THIF-type NAD/FAD binding fold domain-containing protein n=3 Tax=unclassified Candidatus Desantisiibacteriota TaxID=3106372 RepID=A0A2M7SFH0_9BACT|nr:MAG: hypothetical protein AUJ66_08715 [Candidatus Desantisbacteria bacterium CG1_02_38_46]PIU51017.1 MAG: hypothetical protein COS91_06455 [Candidatus Desantisbacteria bacterium CG07_land_8_20_14_0_80_39_15]PIZ18239.1 MAG: hypothetical protein COY52_00470 [Candidatus Desantisbacteria bacterium CG_4_10_14_0_8_um_filter_48_22]